MFGGCPLCFHWFPAGASTRKWRRTLTRAGQLPGIGLVQTACRMGRSAAEEGKLLAEGDPCGEAKNIFVIIFHHFQLASKSTTKSELDEEREKSLLLNWVELVEERNAISIPTAGIPGAPAERQIPLGYEQHCPLLFLQGKAKSMEIMKKYLL